MFLLIHYIVYLSPAIEFTNRLNSQRVGSFKIGKSAKSQDLSDFFNKKSPPTFSRKKAKKTK